MLYLRGRKKSQKENKFKSLLDIETFDFKQPKKKIFRHGKTFSRLIADNKLLT